MIEQCGSPPCAGAYHAAASLLWVLLPLYAAVFDSLILLVGVIAQCLFSGLDLSTYRRQMRPCPILVYNLLAYPSFRSILSPHRLKTAYYTLDQATYHSFICCLLFPFFLLVASGLIFVSCIPSYLHFICSIIIHSFAILPSVSCSFSNLLLLSV